MDEDTAERLQVKVNVETLIAQRCTSNSMLGSARQYFEKAKNALENQSRNEYQCLNLLLAVVLKSKATLRA